MRWWGWLLIWCWGLTAGVVSTAAAVPEGFQSTVLVSSGLEYPTGLGTAPDGRIFILEQGGKVKIYKNGALLPTPFYQFSTTTFGDRGLLGIDFDPNFLSNKYVYFYYNGSDLKNYVVRLSAEGDVFAGTPTFLYQTDQPSGQYHGGGTLQFGPDGKIYVSLGDNGYAANAQDLSVPFGKIIRLNPDGSTPGDNPFVGQEESLGEIWAYGLRNPFRFQFDRKNGRLYAGDVGQNSWEEINLIAAGGNYGWPIAEGDCGSCPYVNPIYQYPQDDNESTAVVGGVVYRGNVFPEDFQGKLYFGDYAKGFIKQMTLNGDGSNGGVSDFYPDAGAVVDLKEGVNGAIYYVTIFPGRLYRISYLTGNQWPVAVAGADVTDGPVPLTVNFSSNGSGDPEGNPLTYLWDLGDGTTLADPNPSTVYNDPGRYTVKLKVSDGELTSEAVNLIVEAGEKPQIDIISPSTDVPYQAGETVHFYATARDSDNQIIGSENMETEILFHHHTHVHPFLKLENTGSGDFTVPVNGEEATDVRFEIIFWATDSHGLKAKKSINIYPEVTSFNLSTNPTGLKIKVDGREVTAPVTLERVVGYESEVEVIEQESEGSWYKFDRWDDGGPNKRTIKAGEGADEYLANLRLVPPYNGEYFNNRNLTGEPTLVRNDQNINFDWPGGSPDPVIQVDNFSARWTKTDYFAGGKYKFTTITDDGVRLWADGELLIDGWVPGAVTRTAEIELTQGDHAIKMEYFEGGGSAKAIMSYELVEINYTGFKSEYFDNRQLAGTPVLIKDEPEIDFDWGNLAAADGLPADDFSVRFSKIETWAEGNYRFELTADDGVRLWVGSDLIVDQWRDQSPTKIVKVAQIEGGEKEIKLEYYEHQGGAVARLDWEPTEESPTPEPTPAVPVPTKYKAEYFDNNNLQGNPAITRDEEGIEFWWWDDSPGEGIPTDNFSARWTKTDLFEEGVYQFEVLADDGVRIRVDERLVLDQWQDQPPTNFNPEVMLTSGEHKIEVEYYEKEGGAVAVVKMTRAEGFLAKYWNYTGIPIVPESTADLTIYDALASYDWGNNGPGEGIGSDYFVAEWQRSLELDSGNYEISVVADDGVRLWIDGVPIVDQWKDQPPTLITKVIFFDRLDEHEFKLQYYEKEGGAVMRLFINKIWLDNFEATYFDNRNLAGTARMSQTEKFVNHDWGSGGPGGVTDNFSARWRTEKVFGGGEYIFIIKSDDGARLLVDQDLKWEDWTDHSVRVSPVSVTITPGIHEIVLEYYERQGSAQVSLK